MGPPARLERNQERTKAEALNSPTEQLASAAADLPLALATSMEHALAEVRFPIRAGSYDRDGAMCPLGAADAYAEEHGGGRFAGYDVERYGARVLHFAVSFDLCAEALGVEPAVAVVTDALRRSLVSLD